MKYYVLIQSTNDVISNSSTEILTVRTDYTPEILKELLLNYAYYYDASENPCPDDISVSYISVEEKATEMYGEVRQEELHKLEVILCKRLEIDYLKWTGKLYMVEIDKNFDKTIEFMKTNLGAV